MDFIQLLWNFYLIVFNFFNENVQYLISNSKFELDLDLLSCTYPSKISI